MSARILIPLTLCLFGCRSGEAEPSSKAEGAAEVEDSGNPWYDYDEDDGGGGGDDDDGGDDDGKDDDSDGKDDGGDGGGTGDYADCPDDFDPNESCEVEWEDGGICMEGDTLWYCDGGVWLDK